MSDISLDEHPVDGQDYLIVDRSRSVFDTVHDPEQRDDCPALERVADEKIREPTQNELDHHADQITGCTRCFRDDPATENNKGTHIESLVQAAAEENDDDLDVSAQLLSRATSDDDDESPQPIADGGSAAAPAGAGGRPPFARLAIAAPDAVAAELGYDRERRFVAVWSTGDGSVLSDGEYLIRIAPDDWRWLMTELTDRAADLVAAEVGSLDDEAVIDRLDEYLERAGDQVHSGDADDDYAILLDLETDSVFVGVRDDVHQFVGRAAGSPHTTSASTKTMPETPQSLSAFGPTPQRRRRDGGDD